jgi:hypothetical protein
MSNEQTDKKNNETVMHGTEASGVMFVLGQSGFSTGLVFKAGFQALTGSNQSPLRSNDHG